MTLSASQRNFLTLHVKRVVVQWNWFFSDSHIRAIAGPRSASVTRGELSELMAAGLLEKSFGVSIAATQLGRTAVEEMEAKTLVIFKEETTA